MTGIIEKNKSSTEAEENNLLQQFVHRLEKLEKEKEELSEGMSDIYNDAKNEGFDSKALKKIISLRKTDRKNKRQRLEDEMILDHYKAILGME